MYEVMLRAALLLLLAQYSGYAQCSPTCGTGGVPPGFQAIILGAPFKYYGNITAINATMYFKNPSFRHAIYLQIWRPVNQTTAFTQTASQFFYADPVVTQGGIEIQLPSQFVNKPPIQLPFIPNDVLGYYVIEDTTNKYSDIGFADSLSPYIMNSSEPSSINVYTTNTSFPLQFFSISGPPTFPNVHLLITIAYTTTFPSPSVRGNSTTVLGACPQSTSMTHLMDTPSPTSSSPPYYQSLLMLTTSASSSYSFSSSYSSSSSFPSSSPMVSTPPSLPPTTTSPPTSFPIAAVSAIVGGTVCIVLIIGIVAAGVCILRRRCTGVHKDGNEDRVSTGIVHYESKQGTLYALPDKMKEVVPRTNFNKPDIESYATSYEVNGYIHTYQEPGEMMTSPLYQQISAEKGKADELFPLPGDQSRPHLHQMGPQTSETGLQSSTFSLTSPSHNPRTLNSDLQAAQPPPPPRSRTLSTRTSKPPQDSISTLTRPLPPRPPSQTSHDSPAPWYQPKKPVVDNRLFTELDEQGFHVPSSQERQTLQDPSCQSSYSRLTHSKVTRCSSLSSNFFEQNEVFWDPPSSTSELYDVLSKMKYREIHRDSLSITSILGSGNFGTVCKGTWTFSGGQLNVAIKMLKDGASEEDKVKFLQEAAIMGQFSHPNVVKMYGVVTVDNPLLLILELIPNGDLRNFVRKYRSKKSTCQSSPIPTNLSKTFVSFAKDVACGMTYLSKKNFVHRDLAARNVFLTEDLRCKIGDFGMARDLTQSYACIYQSQGGLIPLKWSAPEAIAHYQYNTASDVWSFGMVLYEVWSLGHKPFGKVPPEKVGDLVTTGYCQPPPPGCSRAIYELMVKCWHPKAAERPSFSELYHELGKPVEDLLVWTPEDRECGEHVSELGAPMACSRNLYPDLQNMYTASTYV